MLIPEKDVTLSNIWFLGPFRTLPQPSKACWEAHERETQLMTWVQEWISTPFHSTCPYFAYFHYF